MRRPLTASAAITALALSQFAIGSASAQDLTENEESTDNAAVTLQTEAEALQQDLALIAKANGWTIEQSERQYRNAEVVGDLAEALAASHPESFIGSELPEDPADAPILYVKGKTPMLVAQDAATLGVRVVDDQPYSFLELEEREFAVHSALYEQGYDQISTGFDLDGGGRIDATVYDAEASASDVTFAALPANLAEDVSLTVATEPMAAAAHAYGGARVRDDGTNECTSGWTVIHSGGTTGVTTAGHCAGINEIVEDGVGPIALDFRNQHQGSWGDVEWHSSSHSEPAQFYSEWGTLRETLRLEARANISVNENICVYGRFSNVRNCDLEARDVSMNCTYEGITYGRLVQMNGRAVVLGDSGGGWSLGNKAFGSTWGWCGGLDVFSVADLYDEALGVRVRLS
jgi:hypothetical protein